jgi:hypothetical protein
MSLYEELEKKRKPLRKVDKREAIVFAVRLKPEQIDALGRGMVVKVSFRGIDFVIQKAGD